MSPKLRSLAILAVVASLLSAARARAQYEDGEQDESFSERIQSFGRSLVGPYRPNNRSMNQAQPQSRRAAPARQDEDYDTSYDESIADDQPQPRQANNRATANDPSQRRGRQAAAPDPVSTRRTQPAPAAQAQSRRVQQQTAPAKKPATDKVERVARAVNPAQTVDDIPPPAAETAPAAAQKAEPQVTRSAGPSITVETIGPHKISVGKQATYKLVVKNTGSMAAHDVVVTAVVPDSAEMIDARGTSGATEPAPNREGLNWKLGSLAAGGREELSLDIVPRKSQPFELGVRWTQAPVASQTTVEVQEPKLALSLDGPQEVSFGDRSIYKLLLSNPGNGDAENVVITLMPLTASDGPPASHPLGLLRAGESKTIEIELVARQAGQVTIHAEAKAAGDIAAVLEEHVVVRRAALAVAVQAPKLQYANTPAHYEVRLKNAGNASAQNLRVVCKLPRGAEYISCSSSGHHDIGENAVQWTIGSLEAEAELSLTCKCLLKTPGANQIDVSCAADRDLQQGATAATHVEAVADLAMEIVDPSGPVEVGADMVYEVHVRNRGTKTAEMIDVVTYFSQGIEPVACEGGAHELKPGMVVIRTIPAIQMGQDVVYKIKARAETAGTHRFRVELNCKPLDTKLTAEETTLFYSEPAESTQ